MDAGMIIAGIEWLELLFRLPDNRPLPMADWKAASQKHDETYADDPCFRLWKPDYIIALVGSTQKGRKINRK
jgi:hypothetical protein